MGDTLHPVHMLPNKMISMCRQQVCEQKDCLNSHKLPIQEYGSCTLQ